MLSNPVRWMIAAPLSVALGWLLGWFGVPAAWILGAIIASAALALSTGRDLPLNKHVYSFSRGLIGIIAAVPLIGVGAAEILRLLPPGIVITAVTLGIGVLGGMLLARREKTISQETGILSMLAGGASMVPAIAVEVGADHRFVSLTQYLRLVAVSVTLPLVAGVLPHPNETGGAVIQPEQDSWLMVLLICAVALFTPALAQALRIPVPGVLGPLLATLIIGAVLPDAYSMVPPEPLRIFAFLAIGWMCGGAMSVPALKVFATQLPATITFIVVIMAACAVTALPLMGWLDITYFEAYLATSPGALETVLALSSEGGAGPEVVVIQLIRLIGVLLIAGFLPQLIRLLARFEK